MQISRLSAIVIAHDGAADAGCVGGNCCNSSDARGAQRGTSKANEEAVRLSRHAGRVPAIRTDNCRRQRASLANGGSATRTSTGSTGKWKLSKCLDDGVEVDDLVMIVQNI